MSLPDWTPLDKEKRKNLKKIVDTFEQQYIITDPTVKTEAKEVDAKEVDAKEVDAKTAVVKAAADAKAAAKVKTVDLDLLRSLKASGVPDQDLILIGAAMIANK